MSDPVDSSVHPRPLESTAPASSDSPSDSPGDNDEAQPPPPQPPPPPDSPVDYQALLDAKPAYDPLKQLPLRASRSNRPERLALCVDASSEFAVKTFRMRNGEATSLLDLTLKSFHLLAQNKLRLGSQHQVSLLGMRANRITVLEPFTADSNKLARATASNDLRDLLQQPAGDEADFSLDCLLEYARSQLKSFAYIDDDALASAATARQPSLLRIVLLCCRSKTPPHLSERLLKPLLGEPDLFFDILYVHDPPGSDNRAEEIFTRLCCLESEHSRSYIHEVLNNPTAFFNMAATFLAHPLQRPPQPSANYRLPRPPQQQQQQQDSVSSLPPTVLSQPDMAD